MGSFLSRGTPSAASSSFLSLSLYIFPFRSFYSVALHGVPQSRGRISGRLNSPTWKTRRQAGVGTLRTKGILCEFFTRQWIIRDSGLNVATRRDPTHGDAGNGTAEDCSANRTNLKVPPYSPALLIYISDDGRNQNEARVNWFNYSQRVTRPSRFNVNNFAQRMACCLQYTRRELLSRSSMAFAIDAGTAAGLHETSFENFINSSSRFSNGTAPPEGTNDSIVYGLSSTGLST